MRVEIHSIRFKFRSYLLKKSKFGAKVRFSELLRHLSLTPKSGEEGDPLVAKGHSILHPPQCVFGTFPNNTKLLVTLNVLLK